MDPSRRQPPDEAREGREATSAVGWWLRLQLGLALAGGAVWLVGAGSGSDFLAGLGAGLLIAALVLRVGRRSAARRPPTSE